MSCLNLAYSGAAKIAFSKFKEVSLLAQGFSLPGVRVMYPSVQGPTQRTPMSPTGIQYEPLTVTFLISENFEGYLSVLKWLKESPTKRHAENFSDGSIILLSNSKTPIANVTFRDLIPTSIMSVPFDVTAAEPQPLRAIATFDYTSFEFE